MIFDSRLEFADAATLATAVGTANLTNVIDTSTNALNATRDLGNGEQLYLIITVDTDITSGGTGTLAFQLVSDSAAAIAVNGTQIIHATSRVVTVPAVATLAAKTKAGSTVWVLEIPQGDDYKQYIGVQQVVGTAVLTAGKVNAFLTLDATGWRAYSDFN
jgi:hypothetical protein